MKKTMTLVVMALLCAGLSGCTDLTSPQGAVRTAGYALGKNKLRMFKGTLTGEAFRRYGNAEGMAELRKQFAGLDLNVGQATLVDQNGRKSDYRVEVLGRPTANPATVFSKLAEAEVHCETQTVYHHSGMYGPYDPGFDNTTEETTCLIAELRI